MKAKSRNSLLLFLFASLSIFAAIALYDSFGPDSFVFRNEIRRGNRIVSRIEAFHQQYRRLPTSMEELGVGPPDAERFFYEPCDRDRFIVWFGTRLGESMTYDSSAKAWNSLNIACAGGR